MTKRTIPENIIAVKMANQIWKLAITISVVRSSYLS